MNESIRDGSISQFENRFLETYREAASMAAHWRGLGETVVLTQGSWDLFHIGHARYLERAATHGSVLFVGVDSDAKIRKRKGQNRPKVPQSERIELLAHIRSVDHIVLKGIDEERYLLTKAINPHILIGVEGTYELEQIKELSEFCGKVIILPRQAETSTSAKIRELTIKRGETDHEKT